jgi:dienelactone hydrolase
MEDDVRNRPERLHRISRSANRSAKLTTLLLTCLLADLGCQPASVREPEPAVSRAGEEARPTNLRTVPRVRAVGTRGFFALDGPFAEFDSGHSTVEVWTPEGDRKAPVVVYAHGGAGYREDDRARVAMFRRNGFATISFDSYEMNGFDDWEFVTRRITNGGKQDMIWGVFKGAVAYAQTNGNWDRRNIILYGASNGGRVVLYAGTQIASPNIRAIVSEAPAASGYVLGDLTIPTIIPFGALDNWAGQSATDFVWTRTFPDSPISIEAWVRAQEQRERPVRFIFYKDAGHLMFEGPLQETTVRRGDTTLFTAYQGAADGVLKRYESDVISFVRSHLVR